MVHILISSALVALAFLVFGRGMVKKSRGKRFNPLPAFALLLVALSYPFIFGEGSWLDSLGTMLLAVGIGMSVDALYLAANKEKAKLFLVPGILALIMAAFVNIIGYFVNQVSCVFTDEPERVTLLLELGPDDEIREVKSILKKYKADYTQAFPQVDLDESEDLAQVFYVQVDSLYHEPLMMELKHDAENVDHVEINHGVELFQPQPVTANKKGGAYLANDPYLDQQWYANVLRYNEAYTFLKDKQPTQKIQLAIVDTGVDGVHEDLSGVFKKSPGSKDNHGHGTHCAGIAAGETNNEIGIGSLNWEGKFITLTGYPALDASGRGTDRTVANAIINAAEGGADVISMSLGGFHPRPPKVQVDAVKYARKLGAIVIVAAGNSNDDARRYSPANIEGVIVVAAMNENLDKAPFSNINTKLKMPIAAPGVNIMSSFPGSEYRSFSGTSMATPLVAGIVGMMKSFQPDLTTEQVYKLLKDTGKEVNDSGKTGKVVQPVEVLQAVSANL
ncbi:MAG: S8 family serine peptidase [Bacteroidota bacterium]